MTASNHLSHSEAPIIRIWILLIRYIWSKHLKFTKINIPIRMIYILQGNTWEFNWLYRLRCFSMLSLKLFLMHSITPHCWKRWPNINIFMPPQRVLNQENISYYTSRRQSVLFQLPPGRIVLAFWKTGNKIEWKTIINFMLSGELIE